MVSQDRGGGPSWQVTTAAPLLRAFPPQAALAQIELMPDTRIGISGWTYGPWRGVFYPKDLPHKQELGYASRAFNSIEINGTFYSLQRPSSFQKWYEETPADFVFAVKGG